MKKNLVSVLVIATLLAGTSPAWARRRGRAMTPQVSVYKSVASEFTLTLDEATALPFPLKQPVEVVAKAVGLPGLSRLDVKGKVELRVERPNGKVLRRRRGTLPLELRCRITQKHLDQGRQFRLVVKNWRQAMASGRVKIQFLSIPKPMEGKAKRASGPKRLVTRVCDVTVETTRPQWIFIPVEIPTRFRARARLQEKAGAKAKAPAPTCRLEIRDPEGKVRAREAGPLPLEANFVITETMLGKDSRWRVLLFNRSGGGTVSAHIESTIVERK